MIVEDPEVNRSVQAIFANLIEADNTNCDLLSRIREGSVPPLMTIFKFMFYLFRNYSPTLNIIALEYANRMSREYGLRFHARNWRCIWTCVTLLSKKMWEDMTTNTWDYLILLTGVNLSQLELKEKIKELEKRVLHLLDYKILVKSETHFEYFSDLFAIHIEIFGVQAKWERKPLTRERDIAQTAQNSSKMSQFSRHRVGEFPLLKDDKKADDAKNGYKSSGESSTDNNYSPVSLLSSVKSTYSSLGSISESKRTEPLQSGMNTWEDVTRNLNMSRFVLS